MKFTPAVTSVLALSLASTAALANGTAVGAAPAPAATSSTSWMDDVVTQNSTQPNIAPSFNWQNRVTVGGNINFDGRYGSRGVGITPFSSSSSGSDESAIYLNNGNVFVDADVNQYIKAHVDVAYLDNQFTTFAAENTGSSFNLDEAYVTLSDFNSLPYYARVGRMYTPFGHYDDPYPLQYSLTQLLEQVNGNTAEVGFVTPMGLYGDAFAFDGRHSTSTGTRIDNFGGKIGFTSSMNGAKFDGNVSYLSDMRAVDYTASVFGGSATSYSSSLNRTEGLAAHIDGSTGPFGLYGDYVTALGGLGFAQTNVNNGSALDTHAWAYDVGGTYSFDTMAYPSSFGVAWDQAKNAAFLSMPTYRIMANYTVSPWKYTDVSLLYSYDKDFDTADGGTDKGSDTVAGRLAVHF